MSDIAGAAAPVAEGAADGTPAPIAPVEGTVAPVAAEGTPAAPVAPVEGTPAAPDANAPVGAPEAYTEFTLPEGMVLDTAALEMFTPMAKELDLSQENAQKLITLDAERKQAEGVAQQEAWAATNDEWRAATRSDPTIGGANLEQSLAHSNKFLEKFGSPELRTLLDETGVGNRVEVIRLFAAAGKAMGEDTLVSGGATAPVRTIEQRLLPNQAV